MSIQCCGRDPWRGYEKPTVVRWASPARNFIGKACLGDIIVENGEILAIGASRCSDGKRFVITA